MLLAVRAIHARRYKNWAVASSGRFSAVRPATSERLERETPKFRNPGSAQSTRWRTIQLRITREATRFCVQGTIAPPRGLDSHLFKIHRIHA